MGNTFFRKFSELLHWIKNNLKFWIFDFFYISYRHIARHFLLLQGFFWNDGNQRFQTPKNVQKTNIVFDSLILGFHNSFKTVFSSSSTKSFKIKATPPEGEEINLLLMHTAGAHRTPPVSCLPDRGTPDRHGLLPRWRRTAPAVWSRRGRRSGNSPSSRPKPTTQSTRLQADTTNNNVLWRPPSCLNAGVVSSINPPTE